MPQTPEEKREKARWSRILRVYGLTKEQYAELDLGHCPICLRVWGDGVLPVVDHDHVDKVVRGIVCRYCNHRRIGHHRDSNLVQRIAKYLEGPFHLKIPSPPKKKKKKSTKKK
jgi:DNA-directed RNA polymerase subunit RPC12/RpoP